MVPKWWGIVFIRLRSAGVSLFLVLFQVCSIFVNIMLSVWIDLYVVQVTGKLGVSVSHQVVIEQGLFAGYVGGHLRVSVCQIECLPETLMLVRLCDFCGSLCPDDWWLLLVPVLVMFGVFLGLFVSLILGMLGIYVLVI